MSGDEQAIRNLIATWHRATALGDVESILELMTEDVVFLVAGQAPLRGRQAFDKGFRSLLTHHRVESSFDIQEIEISGDWAYCWTHLTVQVIPLSEGATISRVGNALSILHKDKTGLWRIVRDANMLAPATGSGS